MTPQAHTCQRLHHTGLLLNMVPEVSLLRAEQVRLQELSGLASHWFSGCWQGMKR